MNPRHLSEHDIAEIHAAAVGLGIDRHALLDGVNSIFAATLPLRPDAASQFLTDLHFLNGVGTLIDGSNPLQTWLRNAIVLAGPRHEVSIFRKHLKLHTARLEGSLDDSISASPQRKNRRVQGTRSGRASSREVSQSQAELDSELWLTYVAPTPDLVDQFGRAGHTEAVCRNAATYGAYYLRENTLIPADDTVTTVGDVRELRALVIDNQRDAWRTIKKLMVLIEKHSIIARAVALSVFEALDRQPLRTKRSMVDTPRLMRWYTGRLLLLSGHPAPVKTFGKLVAHPDESTSLNACDAVADLLKVLFAKGHMQTHRKASRQVIAGVEKALRHTSARTREVAFEAMLWIDHPHAAAALTSAVVDGRVSLQFAESKATASADALHKELVDRLITDTKARASIETAHDDDPASPRNLRDEREP